MLLYKKKVGWRKSVTFSVEVASGSGTKSKRSKVKDTAVMDIDEEMSDSDDMTQTWQVCDWFDMNHVTHENIDKICCPAAVRKLRSIKSWEN